MRCRIRTDRLPLGEPLLLLATMAFATYIAYEFTVFAPLGAPHRPRYIDLNEALLLAVLFCFGLLSLSWRYFCLQQNEAARRRVSERRALKLAERDGLTGLANRPSFERAVTAALSSTVPAGLHAIVLVDLNDFRRINDTHGYRTGDEVLVRVARRLRKASGDGLLARLGNDEFGVLLTNLVRTEEVTNLVIELAEAVRRPMLIGDTFYELEIDVGVACTPEDQGEPVELLRKAEVALHRAKSAPGGAVRFFEPAMDQSIREHAVLERDLRSAIEEGAIQAHFQPIVELASHKVVGFEALARWTHPVLGHVAPERFIHVAERCGLIDTLSEHLLRQAARAALEWPVHLRLAFNVSPAQLNSETWPQRLLVVLEEIGLAPRRVELEVTETALVHDLRCAQRVLSTLRRGGVRVALDDFGTGASSLHHLREFKVDTLKVDRAFVAAVSHGADATALIRGVIGLAHGLELTVTAEGIESERQEKILLELGCDQAQGHLFGAALPVTAAAALAARGTIG